MVATNEYPRRCLEQGRGGSEEVRAPGRPVVAPGRAGAADISHGTRALAIEVVADMDDEIRLQLCCKSGEHRKRPLGGVVAVLQRRRFDSTAGVAEHDDALRRGDGSRRTSANKREIRAA